MVWELSGSRYGPLISMGWLSPAPFPIEVQGFPAVADGGPDLAPTGLWPQHINHHASTVAAGLVAIQLQEPIFPIRKILSAGGGNGPGFSRPQLGKSFQEGNHRHGAIFRTHCTVVNVIVPDFRSLLGSFRRLDKSRRIVYCMVDECETGWSRKSRRSGEPSALQPTQ